MRKVAAIDIGSNAIRLAIAQSSNSKLKLLANYRLPIRLGADVFSRRTVSLKKIAQIENALYEFKDLCLREGVSDLRAVGTSALRDASNGKQLAELVHKRCQIRIEIIDGLEEAHLISCAIKHRLNLQKYNCLLMDIGGGSVEFTLLLKGEMGVTRSFPVGAVRLLEFLKKKKLGERDLDSVLEDFLAVPLQFVQRHILKHKLDFVVGTGGNFDELLRLKKRLHHKRRSFCLKISELQKISDQLRRKSFADRVTQLKIEKGRADVIVPASLIILSLLSHTGSRKIIIPGVGLKEGLLWTMLSAKRR